MGEETEARLRRDVQRLNQYISDQRLRHSKDTDRAHASLEAEIKYSNKLRAALEDEYKHCEELRRKLNDRKATINDLKDELDDERKYSEKLEAKLDKRARQIEKLEDELYDLEEDYEDAYKALKKMSSLRHQLEDAKISSKYAKQRVAQLQDEVRSLRSQSPSSSAGLPRVIVTAATPSPIVPAARPPPVVHHVTPAEPVSDYSDAEEDVEEEDEEEVSDGEAALSRRSSRVIIRDRDLYESPPEDVHHGRGYFPEEEQVIEEVPPSHAEEEFEPEPEPEDDSEPGQRLRALADREMALAERESQRAREAYASGNKAFAKQLKDTALEHRANAREYNRQAAAQIFHSLNPTYHTSPSGRTRMDLHRLFTREALEFVRSHLAMCRARGIRRSEIIVGRGNHSVGGVARLKPAVLEMLGNERDVEIDHSAGNPGSFSINLLDVGGYPDSERWAPVVEDEGSVAGKGGSRARLDAVARGAAEVRDDLARIEHGMEQMNLSKTRSSGSRQGLRDVTNRSRS